MTPCGDYGPNDQRNVPDEALIYRSFPRRKPSRVHHDSREHVITCHVGSERVGRLLPAQGNGNRKKKKRKRKRTRTHHQTSFPSLLFNRVDPTPREGRTEEGRNSHRGPQAETPDASPATAPSLSPPAAPPSPRPSKYLPWIPVPGSLNRSRIFRSSVRGIRIRPPTHQSCGLVWFSLVIRFFTPLARSLDLQRGSGSRLNPRRAMAPGAGICGVPNPVQVRVLRNRTD